MDYDQRLQNARQMHKEIKIADKEEFKSQVLFAIEGRAASFVPRLNIGQKKMGLAMAAGIALVPLLGFTGYNLLIWGTRFETSSQNFGPASQSATPAWMTQILDSPGVRRYNLKTSRSKANFPIRQLGYIRGWTKILSEGVVFPETVYQGSKLSKVTAAPIQYIDIYSNSIGQRIAVTQYREDLLTASLRESRGSYTSIHPIDPGFLLGADATELSGFKNSLAYLIAGKWSSLPSHSPFSGTYENVVIFHEEKDNVVTEVTIDAYGNVAPAILEAIGQDYLNAKY